MKEVSMKVAEVMYIPNKSNNKFTMPINCDLIKTTEVGGRGYNFTIHYHWNRKDTLVIEIKNNYTPTVDYIVVAEDKKGVTVKYYTKDKNDRIVIAYYIDWYNCSKFHESNNKITLTCILFFDTTEFIREEIDLFISN